MMYDTSAAAMQRYHDRFDSKLYNTMGKYIASNLNADRDDERVVSLVVAAQNGALDLCHHPRPHRRAAYGGGAVRTQLPERAYHRCHLALSAGVQLG